MTARKRRRMHMALLCFWAIQIPPTLVLLDGSLAVKYLVLVSQYANVVGHWSAYSAETPVEQESERNE